MKHSFLVFTVAFLCVFSGCSRKKKINEQKKVLVITSGETSKNNLIARSFQKYSSQKEKPNFEKVRPSVIPESLKERIQAVEARLSDIPVPVLVQPVAASDDTKGCYTLVYETVLPFSDIKKFYLQEMVCAGWQKGACFEGEEFLSSFKKNNSSCIISLRPNSKCWGITYPATIHLYVQR